MALDPQLLANFDDAADPVVVSAKGPFTVDLAAADAARRARLFPHVMGDIETMSTHTSEALTLSAAFVPFSLHLDGVRTGAPLLIIPSLAAQLSAGRRVDRGTQDWWREQSPEAHEHWVSRPATHDLAEMVASIELWMGDNAEPSAQLWANGTVFDLGNLENIILAEGRKPPWRYNKVRDYRTAIALLEVQRARPTDLQLAGKAHDPVHDCLKQIWSLWEVAPASMLLSTSSQREAQ